MLQLLQGDARHLQHSEDSNHAQHAENFGALQSRQVHDAQVGWQDRDQVHQTPEAEEVLHTIFGIEQVAQIVQRKKENRRIFNLIEQLGMNGGVGLDGLPREG